MPEPSKTADPESAFLASLPTIDRVADLLGRRYGLDQADVDEFASWAKARMVESKYEVFRRFAGKSSLNTYLSVVLSNLFKDFRNSRWGRWRPSAAARKLGPMAVRLETLLYRDGHPSREAIELLKARGAGEVELRSLALQLPVRAQAREVGLESAAAVVGSPESADHAVQVEEDSLESGDAARAIAGALAELPPEDRVIMRMRYWDDFSIADIARTLGLEQKPMYRRLEAIQSALGASLEARGVDRARVQALLSRTEGD